MSAIALEPPATAPYQLRPATAADAAWLYDLHVATLRDYVTRTWGWDEGVQRRMFAEGFAPGRSQVVVVDGQDAGVVEVLRRPGEYFIATIAIAPDWQGRGLGTAIIRAVQALAAREGLPVRLQVLKVNPARRLYERLGFAVTGETATRYPMATAGVAGEHSPQGQREASGHGRV